MAQVILGKVKDSGQGPQLDPLLKSNALELVQCDLSKKKKKSLVQCGFGLYFALSLFFKSCSLFRFHWSVNAFPFLSILFLFFKSWRISLSSLYSLILMQQISFSNKIFLKTFFPFFNKRLACILSHKSKYTEERRIRNTLKKKKKNTYKIVRREKKSLCS